MLTEFFDCYASEYKPYKGGSWCYEDGLIYRGLELLHMATGEDRWLAHLNRLISPQIQPGPKLAGYNLSEYNIDNIQSGRALLYLHALTGDTKYMAAADLLMSQLESHPRTKSGVYWHKLRYPWQVWLDGLYMVAPFQIGYAHVRGRHDLIADSLKQIQTALDLNYVPQTGLYAHGFDEARKQAWADPKTGHSNAHWSRALGWLAMCLVDVADLVGPEAFKPLQERTVDLLTRVQKLQAKPGLWLQVIDQPELEGNYIETSASAMFVYAILRARSLGLIAPASDGILTGLTDFAITSGPNGKQRMSSICEVAGLGGFEGNFRDGTPGYYLSEPVVDNDSKGVGPMMMCSGIFMMENEVDEAAELA